VNVEQAAKQLYKLIDVLKPGVTDEPTVQHELVLVKVRARIATAASLISIVEMYRPGSWTWRGHGDRGDGPHGDRGDALIALLRGYGIKEMVRKQGPRDVARFGQSIEEATKR